MMGAGLASFVARAGLQARGRGLETQAALRTLSLSACIIVAAASVVAQVPQRDTRKPAAPTASAAPAPEGTSTLAGSVVADVSGAPVRLAYVVLVGTGTGVLKVTSSDNAGKFSFTKLPADRYTVGASKLPYLGAVAGARRPARPGVPIVLAAGATISDVAIRLPMSAAVSGIIYDERGQPAPGVNVTLQQRKMQNGERVLVGSAGGATTDDRGFYRVYGLAPGEYLVTALPQRLNANARALTDAEVDAALRGTPVPTASAGTDANLAFAPVYYPGTTRMDDAQPVLLSAGDDRQNIDLRLERVRIGRVDGTVVTSDGQPPPSLTIFISTLAGSSPIQMNPTIRTGPDGKFSFTTAPGSFTLMARVPSAAGGQFAFSQVDITGGDVSSVQLALQPPLSFTGRLTASGTTTAVPSLAGQRIQVQPLSRALSGMASPLVTPTTATGEFTVSNLVPGRFVIGNAPFLGASTASVVWGLESVSVDGKDVTDLPVTITSGALPKDVSIVIGDRWQELSGRLTDAAGAGVSDYTVMVFPMSDAYWITGSRRIVTAQPATDGRFTIGGPGPSLLPAGEYYLAAVTDVSKDEQYDPAFLQSLVASAIRVTLAPGGRQTQNLRVR